MTELSPLKTWDKGGEGGKGWFSWTKVYFIVCYPGSFLLETRATRVCYSGSSVDGVVYERATFPLGHSCSELLFSF